MTASELREVAEFLAADAQEGRDNGSPGSARVQDFLIERLQTFATGAAVDGTFRHPFAAGTNLLARVPGRDPGLQEVVVVGAHYDHLGIRGGAVFNGATDNAAGVAAVLALGRVLASLPEPPLRSIILALWDAEEDRLLGSAAYALQPVVPLADTVAYVNLDILGSSPVRGLRRRTFLVGVDTAQGFRERLAPLLAGDPLTATPLSNVFGQGRSDHVNFVNGRVPVLFFSDTTSGCYHTPGDDLDTVHFGKALRTAWIALRVVLDLANGPTRPTFRNPRVLPGYEDTVALRDTLATGLCEAEASGLTPDDVMQVESWLATLEPIVAAGSITQPQQGVVAEIALGAVELLESLPCQRN
jgi:hypothetical protein